MTKDKESFRPTRLVQRLKSSVNWDGQYRNPFSFYSDRDGTINQAAINVFGPIFSFDCMGDARFEAGAVPNALAKIHKNARAHKLVASRLSVPSADILRLNDNRNRHLKLTMPAEVSPTIDFYILQPRFLAKAAYAERVIRDQIGLEPTELSMPTYMGNTVLSALGAKEDYYKFIGWLELDNGFFVFLDYEAFKKTAELFDVKHTITTPPSPQAGQKTEAVPERSVGTRGQRVGSRAQPT